MDNVCPFADTIGMQTVLHNAERMLSPGMEIVGRKNASRIWGFISKFVMVDRFARTKFGSEFLPAVPVPRNFCSEESLGTAKKVSVYFLQFYVP